MDADSILAGVAAEVWVEDHAGQKCPDHAVPKPDEIADWLPDCPVADVHEAAQRAGYVAACFAGILPGEVAGEATPENPLPNGTALWDTFYRALAVLALNRSIPLMAARGFEWPSEHRLLRTLHPGWVVALHRAWQAGRNPDNPEFVSGWVTGGEGAFAARLQDTVRQWRESGEAEGLDGHPLVPLVRAWQERPLPGRWDDRPKAIMPSPFAIVRDLRSAQGELFADGPIGFQSAQRSLPGFEDDAGERSPFGRVVPLYLFDSTGTLYEARGQGAPLALRFWVEAVTAPERLDRSRAIRLETTLRELVRRLWPKGWTGPGRDGDKLLLALRAVDGARVPWRGGRWRAVNVVNMPDIRNLDSPVPIDVSLPPGSDRGPLVYRNVLREYGVTSAPLYRLGLAMAYLWDRHFTHGGPLPVRVPVVVRDAGGTLLDARGNPIHGRNGKPAHWNHPKAVRTGEFIRNPELSRIPDLRADDLLAAAFSRADVDAMTPGVRRKALHHVREAAAVMARRGHAVVAESGARGARDWRIRIEPADWHGAPDVPDHPATGNAEPATGNAGVVDPRES